MAVGDCQLAFAVAARRDGIVLTRRNVDGLTDAGHLGLPDTAQAARATLSRIFAALGGDPTDLLAGIHRGLTPDWFYEPSRTFIEVDEPQHFTSDRLLTLDLYPAGQPIGFNLDYYISLCEAYREASDRYRYRKPARGCRRPGGRRAQRAYLDAVRDIALPDLGFSPVVRVPALENDGEAAYTAVRREVRRRLGLAYNAGAQEPG